MAKYALSGKWKLPERQKRMSSHLAWKEQCGRDIKRPNFFGDTTSINRACCRGQAGSIRLGSIVLSVRTINYWLRKMFFSDVHLTLATRKKSSHSLYFPSSKRLRPCVLTITCSTTSIANAMLSLRLNSLVWRCKCTLKQCTTTHHDLVHLIFFLAIRVIEKKYKAFYGVGTVHCLAILLTLIRLCCISSAFFSRAGGDELTRISRVRARSCQFALNLSHTG